MDQDDDTTLDLMGRHLRMAVDLFNEVWRYIEKDGRSPEETDWMIHAAHTSRYHWGLVGKPENLARGEWQISRVYCTAGMPEAARYHAQRVLDICQAHGIGDWDLAYAYEALARAAAIAGEQGAMVRYIAQARKAAEDIKDPDDRDLLLADIDSLPGEPPRRFQPKSTLQPIVKPLGG